MTDLKQKLSDNFNLGEFVKSATAERHDDVLEAQQNPPQDVIDNMKYLCAQTLQPIREKLGVPMKITSGYRSPKLNELVGGSNTSQHTFGQAADIQLPDSFLTNAKYADIRQEIEDIIEEKTGNPVRADVNANFYLFAFICIHLDELDVDQVIHEYGPCLGQPAWVHVSASTVKDKRQILALGKHLPNRKDLPDLVGALNYGT